MSTPTQIQVGESRQKLPVHAIWEDRVCLVLLVAILLLAAALRIHLAPIPLERDEGEYAYAGQLMLQGVPPYEEAWNMKLPGTYAAHALIMLVFGQTATGIHLGLMVVNAATAVLMYLFGRRLFGPVGGLVAAVAFAMLSVGPGVFGTASHATHFVILPAVAATLLLLRRPACPFWAGLLYGIAFVMKQHGACFVLFGLGYLLLECWLNGRRRMLLRTLPAYAAGAALPFAITCLVLWDAGVFGRFWYWTFTYARGYSLLVPLRAGIQLFLKNFGEVVGSAPALWAGAALGLVWLWWKREARSAALLLTAFLDCSFLGTIPGLYFRNHYFILMLPAVALLVGAAAAARPRLTVPIVAISILFSLYQQRDFFFRLQPDDASHAVWGAANSFEKARRAGDWLRAHSESGARVAVLGSEPEIYFYANRRAATGYLYMYPLMEPGPNAIKMQDDLIHQIEAARPEYVAFAHSNISWGRYGASGAHVFDWWPSYRDANYFLAAWIYQRRPDYYISIYRRKP